MRHCRNTQRKRGSSIGPERVCFLSKQTPARAWSTARDHYPQHWAFHPGQAAEKALYRWKFPPGIGAGGIIIPVTFTTKGVEISRGASPSGSKRASKRREILKGGADSFSRSS